MNVITSSPPPPKILCFVLIYSEVDLIARSLAFLTSFSDRLDIVVIENPSGNTETAIRPLVQKYLNEGKVLQYRLMDENIATNAFQVVLEDAEKDLLQQSNYAHILVTEGDLDVKDQHWLDEEINILASDSNIFVCASSLDMSNLPLKTFPDAGCWIPPATAITNLYIENFTGIHLLLFRKQDLLQFLEWRRATNRRFSEVTMHTFCISTRRKWVRTKHALAYHITWDLYQDLSHPYTIYKIKGGGGIFDHRRVCGFKLFTSTSKVL